MLALLPCLYCYCGVVKFYFLLVQSQKEFRCIKSVEKKLVCVHGTSLLPLRCSHSAARGGGGLSLTATRSALFVNLRVVSEMVRYRPWWGEWRGLLCDLVRPYVPFAVLALKEYWRVIIVVVVAH